jgi:hypothetical protein
MTKIANAFALNNYLCICNMRNFLVVDLDFANRYKQTANSFYFNFAEVGK